MIVNQNVLDEYVSYLKKKYKNKIQDLTIEYCTDDYGSYIYLKRIIIKDSQQCKGYGSAIIYDLINLADDCNVRIILYVTNIFGSDLNRLYGFYRKHGFLTKNCNEEMFYIPVKKINKFVTFSHQ